MNINTIFWGLSLLLAIFGFGIQMFGGYMMTTKANAFFAPTGLPDTEFKKLQVENAYESKRGWKDSYVAMLQPDKLVADRAISFETRVPIKAIANSTGIKIDNDLTLKLAAEKWAANYGPKECGRAKLRLADSCEVSVARVKIKEPRSGKKYVSAYFRLLYTLKEPQTLPSEDRSYRFVSDAMPKAKTAKRHKASKTYSFESAARYRAKEYASTARLCKKLIKRNGLCSANILLNAYSSRKSKSGRWGMSSTTLAATLVDLGPREDHLANAGG
ncbi:hypothetical protein ACFQ14_03660 [Pseudahrensia aquimaris]|uniref:Uncharacterized protein n=1 Tax=Pseudahrensia aquimaris TaxID=744461 RepID=A0ABW3FDJ1_9HYPH